MAVFRLMGSASASGCAIILPLDLWAGRWWQSDFNIWAQLLGSFHRPKHQFFLQISGENKNHKALGLEEEGEGGFQATLGPSTAYVYCGLGS